MSEFTMPSLGADMESAVLMEWRVKEGEHVTKGQVIAEVETSKGVIEIEVFEEGIVEKLLIEPDTECAAGTPLAFIRSEGEKTVQEPPVEPLAETAPQEPLPSTPAEPQREVPKTKHEEVQQTQRIKASPAARKKAAEMGINLAELSDTSGGAVHLNTVQSARQKAQESVSEESSHVLEVKAEDTQPPKENSFADGMRQAIAKAMSRSNAEIPHYYLSMAINMTPALTWLEELNSELSIQERILPAALLIRAAVKALQEVPQLNGFWQENTHQLKKEINPGIAISLRKGGLITPALIDAQEMDLQKTMQALGELISRTRAGKLRSSEMTQQSITITNLGDLGVERVYGVIYPPQVAIIGFGRISDAPWAQGDTLSVRKVMHATISGDHRATDGHTGALFLDKLNQLLQNPKELL
ncbi:MAG: 2-oxo acid dehydrogenase subunit E2 [Campylobacterales bacterium]|nr:2-oxo acid dehydrogenase subunit E2 [Campylobacterales bacterium]